MIEQRLIDANTLVGADGLFSVRGCTGNCSCCSLWSTDGCRVILEAPTVDAVEVVHGHWVDENGFTFMPLPEGHRWCHCDKCGHTIMGIPSNYCPNCGADMRGEA